MTSFLDGTFALLLASALCLFIASRIRAIYPGSEGQFLTRVFWATLALRYTGALFLNAYASDSKFAESFWGDSDTYDYGGYLLSLYWGGHSYVPPPSASTAVSGFGFHYFVGSIYYFFGRNQLLVQFLNGAIGALAVLVIYAIARKLFDLRAARWAALFMAFFPQMIFWSCAMYKDPAILLCIALAIHSVLRLRERFTGGPLVLYLASLLGLMALRFYVFYIVAFATIGTLAFAQRRGVFARFVTQMALAGALVAAMSFAVRRETLEQQAAYFDLDRLQITRSDQAQLGRSAFATEGDVSTTKGALAALPVGLVYLLFAPFPWTVSSLRQLLTLPEMLVWYALMPALVRGLRYTVRERFGEALPILVFALMLTGAYAVFQGNVGTAYRQRTQVTMFFFIFMGVGIEEKRRLRERAPRELRVQPALPR